MLAARFHALRDRTLAQVDRVFAEPVRFSPMAAGKAAPERSKIVIEAVLRVYRGGAASVSGGRDRAWLSEINGQKAELHVDRARYPGLVSRPGDKIRALSRPGEPLFSVIAVDDRGASRLVLVLGES